MESACRITFRCDLLVNTHCSDVADDACFSSRNVSWSDCVPRDNPLLVQPIDSDDSYSASLHRYSGVVQHFKGVEKQCCIPNCTRFFATEEHTNGWMPSYLKEHATNRHDVVEFGPVCKVHYQRVLQISAIELLRN